MKKIKRVPNKPFQHDAEDGAAERQRWLRHNAMSGDTFLGVAYPVLLDGAMGTQLAARGLEMGGQNCLSNPEAVRDIHRAYVEAGADILITNTLTMNRVYIETHKVGVGVEVNTAGARLAREAGGNRPVLGDMSSTGQLLEPYGEGSEAQAFAAFREQAQRLANAGVDGFIVETMLDLREALCAVRACRVVAELPVVMTLSFQTSDHGGRTIMGNSAAEIAEAASAAGVVAVGANCGSLDPSPDLIECDKLNSRSRRRREEDAGQ